MHHLLGRGFLVWNWGFGMIIDRARTRLPADIVPAVFALSTRRKLRKLYDGPLFRYASGEVEYDYPEHTPAEGDKIVKIYDQKVNFEHPISYNAIQTDPLYQPTVTWLAGGDHSVPVAKFDGNQYLEIGAYPDLSFGEFLDWSTWRSNISQDISIVAKGTGMHPRPGPMFASWNGTDTISIEPGIQCSKCKINDSGVLMTDSNSYMVQLFIGNEKSQNNRKIFKGQTVQSEGVIPVAQDVLSLAYMQLGRDDDHYYIGTFEEITLHEKLDSHDSDRSWEDSKNA